MTVLLRFPYIDRNEEAKSIIVKVKSLTRVSQKKPEDLEDPKTNSRLLTEKCTLKAYNLFPRYYFFPSSGRRERPKADRHCEHLLLFGDQLTWFASFTIFLVSAWRGRGRVLLSCLYAGRSYSITEMKTIIERLLIYKSNKHFQI